MIDALKYSEQTATPDRDQILLVVTSPMVWSNTPEREDGDTYREEDMQLRVPLPKFQPLKQIEMQALALMKHNSRIRVHIVCSGFLFGNGEQNDIFYEFFRRAWVSLLPELASLPVIGKGSNCMPTIHVSDLTNAIDRIIMQG